MRAWRSGRSFLSKSVSHSLFCGCSHLSKIAAIVPQKELCENLISCSQQMQTFAACLAKIQRLWIHFDLFLEFLLLLRLSCCCYFVCVLARHYFCFVVLWLHFRLGSYLSRALFNFQHLLSHLDLFIGYKSAYQTLSIASIWLQRRYRVISLDFTHPRHSHLYLQH